MGRPRNPYTKPLRRTNVSEEMFDFISAYGGKLCKEPFYRRLERFVANCKEIDLVKQTEMQSNAIEFYINRIKELEAQIGEQKQTKLI